MDKTPKRALRVPDSQWKAWQRAAGIADTTVSHLIRLQMDVLTRFLDGDIGAADYTESVLRGLAHD